MMALTIGFVAGNDLPDPGFMTSCQCDSVGNVVVGSNAGAGMPPPVRTTPPFMVSIGASELANATLSMFGPVTGTFACKCARRLDSPSVQYILSASSPPNCLTTTTMQALCQRLANVSLMQCTQTWSSGATGTANAAGIGTGALLRAVHLAYGNLTHTPACKNAAVFRGAVDSVLGTPGHVPGNTAPGFGPSRRRLLLDEPRPT